MARNKATRGTSGATGTDPIPVDRGASWLGALNAAADGSDQPKATSRSGFSAAAPVGDGDEPYAVDRHDGRTRVTMAYYVEDLIGFEKPYVHKSGVMYLSQYKGEGWMEVPILAFKGTPLAKTLAHIGARSALLSASCGVTVSPELAAAITARREANPPKKRGTR